MANRYAVQSGNWSSLSTWDGGESLPGVGDVVRPSSYTVTIDQDIEVFELRNDASAPALSGGGFVVSSISTTRTITAGRLMSVAGNVSILTLSASSGTLNVIANVDVVTGSAYGKGVLVSGLADLNITGDVYGGTGTYTYGVEIAAANQTVITGDIHGGNGSGHGVVVGGSLAATLTINGDIYAGGLANGVYVAITSTATLVLNGALIAQAGANAVVATTISSITVKGPMYCAGNGRQPLVAALFKTFTGEPVEFHMIDDADSPIGGNQLILTDSTTNHPAASDVRSGTVYGPTDNLTGTMAVPAASSVAYGVPVDNTVGTAVITPSDLWNHEVATGVAAKDRLLTTATDASTATQIATAVTT